MFDEKKRFFEFFESVDQFIDVLQWRVIVAIDNRMSESSIHFTDDMKSLSIHVLNYFYKRFYLLFAFWVLLWIEIEIEINFHFMSFFRK